MNDLTFGQKAVGLSFNPSNNANVDAMKRGYADIIDALDTLRNKENADTELKRLCSIAITEAQTAQMWAVKAITNGETPAQSVNHYKNEEK